MFLSEVLPHFPRNVSIRSRVGSGRVGGFGGESGTPITLPIGYPIPNPMHLFIMAAFRAEPAIWVDDLLL